MPAGSERSVSKVDVRPFIPQEVLCIQGIIFFSFFFFNSLLINIVMVFAEIANGDEQVKADAIRIGNYKDGKFPTDSKEFAKRLFYTVFMGSENR